MKTTGGGNFKPDEQRFVYFAAANMPSGANCAPPNTLVAVNDVMSNRDAIDGELAEGHTVFLDSGIFNLTQNHMRAHPGMRMDDALALAPDEIDGFGELLSGYTEIVKEYEDRLWGYVELDQGGRKNKIATRRRLEQRGLRPIPVYHPLNDGWDYFDFLASRYDRICVGNIVQASTELRMRILVTIWERRRAYPHLWIHGLGYSPTPLLYACPFDSVDSSAWISPLRWGLVRGQVTAALDKVSDHQPNTRYMLGVRSSWDKACQLASWSAHSWTMQWRTGLAELSSLGVDPFPPPDDRETAPCPSRSAA